jgi:hypothetical protein
MSLVRLEEANSLLQQLRLTNIDHYESLIMMHLGILLVGQS